MHAQTVWSHGLFETLWTAAYQAPLSMGFSRQEYWSGVPSPSPMKGVEENKQVENSSLEETYNDKYKTNKTLQVIP